MDRFLVFTLSLMLAVVVSHGAVSSEEYWQSVLPNTPMPDTIRDLLRPDFIDEKAGTSVNVGKGGVHVDTGKGKPKGGTTVDVGRKGGVGVVAGGGNTRVNVGKGGVGVNVGRGKRQPVIVNVNPGKNPFFYKYAATDDQIHDDPTVALFFLEKDLHTGTEMTLQFTKTTSGAAFLPRKEADALPFSSAKLPEILHYYSLKPESLEGKEIEKTVQECEEPATKGEDKYCATSLESMVDFSTSKLGTHVKVIATTVGKDTVKQKYVIGSDVQKLGSPKSVVCHAQNYAYAVFYCHTTSARTRLYVVPLVGEDGTKAEAVSVCHLDTSAWNPKHLAFQVLNVKPGTVPICHFLPQDHVVWLPN